MSRSHPDPARHIPIIVLGASGHARVVAWAIREMGLLCAGYVERSPARQGEMVDGLPIRGHEDLLWDAGPEGVRLANGIGGVARRGDPGTAARRQVFERWQAAGFDFPPLIGGGAVVAPGVELGPGAQVLAGAIVQPGCRIDADAIVNTRASIDHGCRIAAHAHIAPGAVLCGDVSVGAGAFVGAGAIVRQGIEIGGGAVIGAGAVVRRPVAPGETYVGAR